MALRAVTSNGVAITPSSVSLPTGGTFDLYNTADQTTNYERLRVDWSGNVARLFTQPGGTSIPRTLRLGASAASGGSPTAYVDFQVSSFSNPVLDFVTPSTIGTASPQFRFNSLGLSASSGTQTVVSIATTINQSGTAGYTAFDINPTESATGSGTKLLQRWAVGGAQQAYMTNAGGLVASILVSTSGLSMGPTLGGADLTLTRDTADTLALRRSTNAQTFRCYETYTDASNYSRWYQTFSGGFAYYGTQAAGTGTRRPLIVQHFTTTLAALPTAATAGAGSRAVISDATAPVFGAAVVGGGAVVSPVYSDGANWIVG